MEICLIDSLIGYQGTWFSDKASKLSSTCLPSWNSGMSQWYVTYRLWQKPQARPTIPNLPLTCSEDAKLFLNGSMIFPWSSVSYSRPSHCLFYFRTSNQKFWCAHMPSVHFWKNSPMLTGWNTSWILYSWEFSHANSKISLSWYPIPIWPGPLQAYIRAAKRLWLNKQHSLSYLRHWELKKQIVQKTRLPLVFSPPGVSVMSCFPCI